MMAQHAGGAQHPAEEPDSAGFTGTDVRRGETGGLLVWTAAFVMVLLIALLVAY